MKPCMQLLTQFQLNGLMGLSSVMLTAINIRVYRKYYACRILIHKYRLGGLVFSSAH